MRRDIPHTLGAENDAPDLFPPSPLPQVTPTAAFQGDLGLDSLDAVELVMALEEEFGVEIPDAEADKILSTGEAIAYLGAHPQAK